MLIDLHTHSTASDGTESPAQLVRNAAASGLSVVALTDHDTTAGWAAAEQARPSHLGLIRGAEFSTQVMVNGRPVSVHLLAYLFDPADRAIVAEHQRLVAERLHRGTAMVERMIAGRVPISLEAVLRIADGAPVGRPHIGRALVASGVVSSVDEAFATYLADRGPYYVPKADTDLPTAVAMVAAAGGASVIAHPRSRGAYRALDADRIAELADLGLTGLEVDHPDHGPAERAELRGIADRLGLVTTGSSDYHGTNKTLRLGQECTAVDALHRLIAAASSPALPLGPVG